LATNAPSRTVLRFDNFEVYLLSGQLRKNGRPIRLQEQPFQVLQALLERPGEIVTREQLKQKLWPADTFVDFDDGLNTAVKKLRDTLGDSSERPRYIETIPRRGYRFIGTIEDETPQVEIDGAGHAANAQSDGVTSEMNGRRQWLWVCAVAIVLAATSISGWMLSRARSAARGNNAPIASLAVMPFANLSGDPSQEYFADAMTDEMTSDLAKIGALRVISRTSAMHYKGTSPTVSQIARELNVDGIIEGSVLRAGDRVRITVQLIDARSDAHRWSESYERELKDILSLQGELARTIAGEVRAVVTPAEQVRLQSDSVNPEAYNAYLLGAFFARRRSGPAIEKAIEHFQDAIRIDPNYARAYAGLANAYVEREIWGGVGVGKSIHEIRAATLKALELDDELPEGHALLARIHFQYDWDWQGTETEYKRAIELNPNLADTYDYYAFYLQAMSRHDEALAAVHRAVELDPVSPSAYSDQGRIEYRARQYEKAISSYQRSLELDDGFIPALSRIVELYQQTGKFDQALAAVKRLQQKENTPDSGLLQLAWIYARSGKRRQALELLRRAEDKKLPQNVRGVVDTYVALGDSENALARLQDGIKDRSILPFVFVDPMLDPLRSDPRFKAMIVRAGIPIPSS
jgi:TolB-like protein/DNA-binding winged helix-turn-helix (wHTH) protein/Tfp pilus assembly protein PilF